MKEALDDESATDPSSGSQNNSQHDVNLSVVDLYTIGIGPSSSHTVGPMRAGYRFCLELESRNLLQNTGSVVVDLYGSLALTGKGHATDTAVIMGLNGKRPRNIDPDDIVPTVAAIDETNLLQLYGQYPVSFNRDTNLVFHFTETLPQHPNGMRITAFDRDGLKIHSQEYFSVGVALSSQAMITGRSIPAITSPCHFRSLLRMNLWKSASAKVDPSRKS